MSDLKGKSNPSRNIKLLFTAYILFVAYWLVINIFHVDPFYTYLFGLLYPILALVGAWYGFEASRQWGGMSSLMGKSSFFFSLGLLSLLFGQLAWSYYNLIAKIEIPYPSVADLGYVLVTPFYVTASICMGLSSGVNFKKLTVREFIVRIIPFPVLLLISWRYFVPPIDIADGNYLRLFLDLWYPLAEAVMTALIVSIAIATYNVLGGQMRKRVLLLILSLGFQFVTDFTFLFVVANKTYSNGGIIDLMYTTSFTIMTLSMILISPKYIFPSK